MKKEHFKTSINSKIMFCYEFCPLKGALSSKSFALPPHPFFVPSLLCLCLFGWFSYLYVFALAFFCSAETHNPLRGPFCAFWWCSYLYVLTLAILGSLFFLWRLENRSNHILESSKKLKRPMLQLKACYRRFLQDGYLARVLPFGRLSCKILQESCKMIHSVARFLQDSHKIIILNQLGWNLNLAANVGQ